MSRSGARQPGDDHRPVDLLLEDLRLLGERLLDQQPVAGVALQVAEQHGAVHRGERAVGIPLLAQQRQPFAEIPRPEIRKTGAHPGGGQHCLGRELHRLALAPGEGRALCLVQLRASQVIDADVLAHPHPTIE